ncbi:ATP-binding protein, partial [Frankia sp. Cr2]|uniref:ATP-binding protein n=1 Tax=Frankia sp. Cr2 TaxID=3073932 RepID=UPI002AD559DD
MPAANTAAGPAGRPLAMDEAGTEPGPRMRLVASGDAVTQPAETQAPQEPDARPNPTSAGTVTLLFTDIEGSTRLVRRFGDLYGEILADCQRLQRHAFDMAGGREIDTQGDSFFIAFRTSKDAVVAAVAAQRALAAHTWPAGGRIRVRMGIHTTEPTPWTGRFVGLGVHRAARLCSAGHGGQVLLSETTHSLIEDGLATGFDVRYLGEHWLKDFDRAERIWQLVIPGLPETFAPLRTPDSSLLTAPDSEPTDADGVDQPDAVHLGWLDNAADATFVGRTHQLRVLRDAWDRARSGVRVLALISGEPGIGKTTLAAQVARTARDDGGLVLYGRWDEEVLAPYQGYRVALGEYARTCPKSVLRAELGEHADEISRLFPEVTERVGVVGAPLAGKAEAERFRLFEALDGWLRAIASRRPVLVILDDLQWADRSSLLLLAHLMRLPRATPLLVVATYRDTGHGELASFLPALTRDTECRRVRLGGLDPEETVALVGRVYGRDLAEPGRRLALELQADTAGNPFFLTEMVRHMVDLGTLTS